MADYAIANPPYELLDFMASQSKNSRELSLARTNSEQAVMWAVKHVTG